MGTEIVGFVCRGSRAVGLGCGGLGCWVTLVEGWGDGYGLGEEEEEGEEG